MEAPGGLSSIRFDRSLECIILVFATGLILYWRILVTDAPPIFWVPLFMLLLIVSWEIIVLGTGARVLMRLGFLVTAVVLVGMLSYREPFQLPGVDLYFDANYAQVLVDIGKWDPSLGAAGARNYYGYYPSLHLVLSSMAIVSGAPMLFLVKYVVPLVVSISMFAAASFMIRRVLSIQKATVPALIYASSLGFMAIGPSRRWISLILGTLAIALLSCESETFQYGRGRFLAAAILLTTFAFSDHFIGPLILMSAMAVAVIVRILGSGRVRSSGSVLLLGAVMYTAWMMFVASLVLGIDIRNAIIFSQRLLALEAARYAVPSMYGYSIVESSVVFLSWAILALLAFGGLILDFSRLNRKENLRPWVWGSLGFAMLGFSAILALDATYNVLSVTLMWFATLLLSRPASSTVLKLSRCLPRGFGKMLVLILLMILFSGSLLGAYSARVLNRSPEDSRLVEEIRGFSLEELMLGKWLATHLPFNASILGDKGSYVLLAGVYNIEMKVFGTWPERVSLQRMSDFFVESKCYFTCRSFYFEVNASVVPAENSGVINRLWDGGTWWLLSARFPKT